MIKFLSALLILISVSISVLCQVKTTKHSAQSFKQLKISDAKATIKSIRLPSLDIQKLIDEDSRDQGPPRFAKGIDVDLDLKDGTWEETKLGNVWTLVVESIDAYSLSVFIDNLSLTEGAELYMMDINKQIVFGPITREIYPQSQIASDIIPGNTIILQVAVVIRVKESVMNRMIKI